jgi:hypothetical protein
MFFFLSSTPECAGLGIPTIHWRLLFLNLAERGPSWKQRRYGPNPSNGWTNRKYNGLITTGFWSYLSFNIDNPISMNKCSENYGEFSI